MNDDLRLERYLADRADTITLQPANTDAVMRRGTRRRNQKRGGVLAAVAVLGVLGTSVIIRDDDSKQRIEADVAAAVVPTDLDWTVVRPEVGLAYGSPSVLAGGSLYALSTAPGPARADTDYSQQHLYRSVDGTEWEEAALPDGIKTSTLYGTGDTLYAVGTAPAGGNARTISVASTTDGGDSWTSVDLPDDVAQLERRFPRMVSISQPTMAAQDATHQVAVVNVSANVMPSLYRSDIPEDGGWEVVDGGVKIFKPMEACDMEGVPVSADPTDEELADYRKQREAVAGACGQKEPEVLATYTWDELGMPADLQAYIGGKAFVYATDDGETFERVEVPGDLGGWGSAVVATPDGYRLFASTNTPTSASTTVLRSTDGRTWVTDSTLDGSFSNAGLLGDRPAVSLWPYSGTGTVQVQQPDGAWHTLDVLSAVEPRPGEELWLAEVAFGPLGLAATVISSPKDGDGLGRSYLVHSKDGSTLSALALSDYFDDLAGGTLGVTVTADAISVRAVQSPDGDAATVEPTDVLVGTPR